MEPFESLSLCAEIAIAITGFSGVVPVFGGSSRGSSAEVNPALFRLIFSGTLTPLALVVIAFLLDAGGFDRALTWRIGSAMHGASVVLLTVFAGRSGERQALLTARGGLFVPVGSVFVVALSLVNAISLHQFWPFLFAIWWGMALGLFAFVQLVFSAQANR